MPSQSVTQFEVIVWIVFIGIILYNDIIGLIVTSGKDAALKSADSKYTKYLDKAAQTGKIKDNNDVNVTKQQIKKNKYDNDYTKYALEQKQILSESDWEERYGSQAVDVVAAQLSYNSISLIITVVIIVFWFTPLGDKISVPFKRILTIAGLISQMGLGAWHLYLTVGKDDASMNVATIPRGILGLLFLTQIVYGVWSGSNCD